MLRSHALVSDTMVRWSLTGELNGMEVTLWEVRRYRGGGSRDQQTMHGYPHTLLILRIPDVDLPSLEIRPRSLLNRVLRRSPSPAARDIPPALPGRYAITLESGELLDDVINKKIAQVVA